VIGHTAPLFDERLTIPERQDQREQGYQVISSVDLARLRQPWRQTALIARKPTKPNVPNAPRANRMLGERWSCSILRPTCWRVGKLGNGGQQWVQCLGFISPIGTIKRCRSTRD
jgi:hypothetical protein